MGETLMTTKSSASGVDPRDALAPSQPSEAAAPTELAPRARVLIVDDTPANLTLLSELLLAKGFDVAVATNGRRARALRSPPRQGSRWQIPHRGEDRRRGLWHCLPRQAPPARSPRGHQGVPPVAGQRYARRPRALPRGGRVGVPARSSERRDGARLG